MRTHRLTRRHFRSRIRSGSRGIQRVRIQASALTPRHSGIRRYLEQIGILPRREWLVVATCPESVQSPAVKGNVRRGAVRRHILDIPMVTNARAAEGDWDVLSKAWLSLMAVPVDHAQAQGSVVGRARAQFQPLRYLPHTHSTRSEPCGCWTSPALAQAPSFSTSSRITRTGRACRSTRTHQRIRPRHSFPVLASFVCDHKPQLEFSV